LKYTPSFLFIMPAIIYSSSTFEHILSFLCPYPSQMQIKSTPPLHLFIKALLSNIIF
jgi:hypothetical protein